MDTTALEQYLRSRDALRERGDKTEALRLLAQSVGVANPTPFMEQNVAALVDLNPAILTLILHRSK